MECYTSSGTFCDMWLSRKALSSTMFCPLGSGNWTTGSLSFSASHNFRSTALWQRQIQVSTPPRIHCASLCEKLWRVTLPKLAELLAVAVRSLWASLPCWGAVCRVGQGHQCDTSDALNAVMGSMKRLSEWCHSEMSFYSQQHTHKPRLHLEKRLHSIQGVTCWWSPMQCVHFRSYSLCPNDKSHVPSLYKLSKVSRGGLFGRQGGDSS